MTEQAALLRKSKQLRKQSYDWGEGNKAWIRAQYHHMPMEMNWLIRFMAYTFLRLGDIRQFKNKHIEVIQGTYNYMRLNLPEVKRHKAPTVSLPPAVNIYKKVAGLPTLRGYGKPDDYVFSPRSITGA